MTSRDTLPDRAGATTEPAADLTTASRAEEPAMTPNSTPGPAVPPGPVQIRSLWDRVAPGFDEHTTPMAISLGEDVLRRVELTAGTTFLDVAAGSGALTVPAARRGARVLAVDVSPAMLDRLADRTRRAGLANVETRVMDGQSLQLEDDSVDHSGSQHGVSLFPDMDRGLAEMVRVTRPGGSVVVAAFGALPAAEFLTYFLEALRSAVPGFRGLPTDPPPLPFQVADPAVLRDRLVRAGLRDVRVDRTVWETPFRSAAEHWAMVTTSNPIGAQLVAELGPEQVAIAQRSLDRMLHERGGSGPAVLRTEVNVGVGVC